MCGRMYQRLVDPSKQSPFALIGVEKEYIARYEQHQLGSV
jgi:hypothetical protein